MPATDSPVKDIIASCSFCGKPASQVHRLVAGPGVFICDECVQLSQTVIDGTSDSTPEESARRRAEFVNRSPDDILATLPALARAAARVEAELGRWVGRLREQGTDWQRIADALETTVSSARQRFDSTP